MCSLFGCFIIDRFFSLSQDESLGPDPFYDLEQHALLGVANFFLECLHHGIKHEYSAPIVAPTGMVGHTHTHTCTLVTCRDGLHI